MAEDPKSTRPSKAGAIGYAIVYFLLLFVALPLTLDLFAARNAWRQIRARGYASATGWVTHSKVESGHILGITFRPDIEYKYSVAGKEYQGNRYRYGQWFSGCGWASRIVASRPIGSRVDVYYAPDDPSDAVLTVGLDGLDLFIAMLLFPFNILILIVLLALWVKMWRAVGHRQPPAGGARIVDDGRCVRVRLWLRPSFSALFAAAALALVGTLVVALGWGFTPPMRVMRVAWGLILGGGALACLLQALRVAGGRLDLVIDDFRQSLTLPPTLGRREALVIPADKIVTIDVEKVEKRHSTGDVSCSYFPTVVYTDSDGLSRRERIAERSEDGAEKLAAWLRERLRIETPTSSPSTSVLDPDDARATQGTVRPPSQA